MVAADLQWWQTSIVYQIYPRSFQDSDADGIGDLRGIQSRLDYLQFLGIGAVWLSPIFESPMKDFGYDISNHIEIDPVFGSMQDFDNLIEDLHSRGLKLILDYIPNHTSDLHPWFQASKLGGAENQYADYYIWKKGKILDDGARVPPNNWIGIFGGSTWEWVEERQEYYYHNYLKEQPDLNYRNPEVRKEMQDVLRFWINRGVDGFRIDAIRTLFENNYDENEELRSKDMPKDRHKSYSHPNRFHQPELHDVIQEWRDMLNQYEKETGKHIFLVAEVYDHALVETMKYYHSGCDMPFNFKLIKITEDCEGTCIAKLVDSWMSLMPPDKWPNFVLGNHDQTRIASRKGEKYADALNLMLLTLPGTPTTYQGEEIAMTNVHISFDDTVDPSGRNFGPDRYHLYSRDGSRTPMQWNSEMNAGFSSANKTWLPLARDYKSRNVELQKEAPSARSSLLMYRQLAKLRQKPAFMNNRMDKIIITKDVFSYVRSIDSESFLVVVNVGNNTSTHDFSSKTGQSGTVVLTTPDMDIEEYTEGKRVTLSDVTLKPGDGLVIKIQYFEKEL